MHRLRRFKRARYQAWRGVARWQSSAECSRQNVSVCAAQGKGAVRDVSRAIIPCHLILTEILRTVMLDVENKNRLA